jgi:hypothetical protein
MTHDPIDLAQLSRDIVHHLGEEWTVLPNHPQQAYEELLRDDGARLRVLFTSIFNRASLTIVGVLPDPRRPGDRQPVRIQTATAKGPRAIAGSIARRLLPTYVLALDQTRRFQQEQAAAAAARERVAAQILALLPEATSTPTSPDSHVRGLTVQWHQPGGPEARVQLRGTAKTADLQLTGIPVDVAVQICRALPPGATTVRIDEEFPAGWALYGTRSEDGTPIFDFTAPPGADTDEHGRPYLRVFANDLEIHEHMSAAARRWRDLLWADEESAPDTASASE